ncbi:hypothetical protein DXZ79_16685 [Yersinia rochesterensis]|uniref:Uncharacterized protein n=1 Tax=Yersinia rochesterensis TaxID=1604335 RepID=A0A8D4SRH4_9GAMM|nr:hypothetical protein DXZ79_16685 [Yersinia rochesterensis]
MLSDGALSAAELFSEVIKKVPLVLKHHVHASMRVYWPLLSRRGQTSETELDKEILDKININPSF